MIGRRPVAYSIISLAYMGLLFYLSAAPVELEVPSFSASDKLSHFLAYGALSCLIYLALQEMSVQKRYVVALAFAVSFLYGILNEIYQHFLPWREADIFDAMANGIGAFSFPMLLRWKRATHRGS